MGVMVAVLPLMALAPVGWANPTAHAPIGHVGDLRAQARLHRGTTSLPVAPGLGLAPNDRLATDAAGRVAVAFRDGSRLVVGGQSEVVLDRFVFDPALDRIEIGGQLAAGALRFIGGSVGGVPGHRLAIRTPVATIGIRGTDVWIGTIDGALGVLLLSGGVEVANAAGTVRLDRPGQGTTVRAADQPPAAVVSWSDGKKARALAMVALP